MDYRERFYFISKPTPTRDYNVMIKMAKELCPSLKQRPNKVYNHSGCEMISVRVEEFEKFKKVLSEYNYSFIFLGKETLGQ